MSNPIDLKDYRSRGFFMPFEGEAHRGTIVELPYRLDVWRDGAKPALKAYWAVIAAIAKFEPVFVVYDPNAFSSAAVDAFPKIPNAKLVPLPYDDSWARDNMPVFVTDGKGSLGAVDYGFNAWGGTYNGLYASWAKDNAVGQAFIEKELNIPYLMAKDFILEGGSIHTNGKGTLLVTGECLLSKGRNPNLTQPQIEDFLKLTLGQKKVIWLPFGVYQDETSGHVDNIACFLDETHVLLGWQENDRDTQFRRSTADLKVLQSETTWDGKPIEVIKMPMPGPLFVSKFEATGLEPADGSKPRETGDRLAASYVNFYMGKDFIVMPSFGLADDQRALHILNKFYQGKKKIISVPGREILLGGGNIHCITKQIPA